MKCTVVRLETYNAFTLSNALFHFRLWNAKARIEWLHFSIGHIMQDPEGGAVQMPRAYSRALSPISWSAF